MIVLGLDTTGPECSVSIVDDAVVLAHVSDRIGRGHAEVLAGMVAQAIEAAGLSAGDIDRLAVCTGPGNFTGLRVALSFAIGFALPRDLPVIGINALVLTHMQMSTGVKTASLIYKDVRRGEFMFASYAGLNPLSDAPPRTGTLIAIQNEAEHFRVPTIEVTQALDTRILAWLAINLDPADYPPVPLYARGPDAKLPGGKTLPSSAR